MKKFTGKDLLHSLMHLTVLRFLEAKEFFKICYYEYKGVYPINIFMRHEADCKRFILTDNGDTQDFLLAHHYENTPTEKILDILQKYHLQGRTNDGKSEIAAVIYYKTIDDVAETRLIAQTIMQKTIDLVNAIIEILEILHS